MAELIGGLTTVNCGKIIEGPNWVAEILGPGYSNHSTNCVVLYANEGGRKISLVYCGERCIVYRFKYHDSLQHYWSRSYQTSDLLSSRKYSKMVQLAAEIYKTLGFVR